MNEQKAKIHPCSLEHYNRYRLRGASGAIIAVGSRADMDRMKTGVFIKGKMVSSPVEGTVEHFACASK